MADEEEWRYNYSHLSMVLGPPKINGTLVPFRSAVVSLQCVCYAVAWLLWHGFNFEL